MGCCSGLHSLEGPLHLSAEQPFSRTVIRFGAAGDAYSLFTLQDEMRHRPVLQASHRGKPLGR
jgi:hypothetical protein